MTTTTAEVVDLITSARPPRGKSEHASRELSLFAKASKAGMDSKAATVLRKIAPDMQEPQWQAWIGATAAMAAGHRPAWVRSAPSRPPSARTRTTPPTPWSLVTK